MAKQIVYGDRNEALKKKAKKDLKWKDLSDTQKEQFKGFIFELLFEHYKDIFEIQ